MIWISAVLSVQIDPRLRETPLSVPVLINASDYWTEILPMIWISSSPPWLKADVDWHVYSNRRICYELDERWIDQFADLLMAKEKGLPELAAQWITNAAANVLHVQYTCHALEIDKWPEEIAPSWPHGKPATELYRQEKSLKKAKNHD